MRPALFLDRDGIINVDTGYVHRADEFRFVDGIFDLCRLARDEGYLIIVVTNQAGIARGYYTEEDFHVLTDWMRSRFEAEGILLANVFYAPFHPEHGTGPYRQDSEDRKPGPGMILKAEKAHGLDLSRSLIIGDQPTDMQAGLAAGVPVRVLVREAKPGQPPLHEAATHHFSSVRALQQAASISGLAWL